MTMKQTRTLKNLLNINRQTIPNETKGLKTRINQLTEDQTKVFNHVETNNETQKLFFVTGPGGIGKSYLLHTIVELLELSGEIVQVNATSGSAAKLIYGKILHSLHGLD